MIALLGGFQKCVSCDVWRLDSDEQRHQQEDGGYRSEIRCTSRMFKTGTRAASSRGRSEDLFTPRSAGEPRALRNRCCFRVPRETPLSVPGCVWRPKTRLKPMCVPATSVSAHSCLWYVSLFTRSNVHTNMAECKHPSALSFVTKCGPCRDATRKSTDRARNLKFPAGRHLFSGGLGICARCVLGKSHGYGVVFVVLRTNSAFAETGVAANEVAKLGAI